MALTAPRPAPEQLAHARVLEERQTPASGDTLPLVDSLHLLQSGQLVNFAAGPNAAPGRILTSGVSSLSAAQIAAELGRSLGVPSELVMDGKQAQETEIAAAIGGALGGDAGGAIAGIVGGVVWAFFYWVVWSYLTYFIGTRFFGGTATPGELLRTLGFASTPNILKVLVFIPGVGGIIGFAASVWSLVAGVIAVRQALDVDTSKAILTTVIAWVITMIPIIFLGGILAALFIGMASGGTPS